MEEMIRVLVLLRAVLRNVPQGFHSGCFLFHMSILDGHAKAMLIGH